jgi:hypothetical protein
VTDPHWQARRLRTSGETDNSGDAEFDAVVSVQVTVDTEPGFVGPPRPPAGTGIMTRDSDDRRALCLIFLSLRRNKFDRMCASSCQAAVLEDSSRDNECNNKTKKVNATQISYSVSVSNDPTDRNVWWQDDRTLTHLEALKETLRCPISNV